MPCTLHTISVPCRLTFGWFIMDALTHLTIEASYLFLALTVTAEKSDSLMALTWKEYGKADHV
jgi:hypothetical protein